MAKKTSNHNIVNGNLKAKMADKKAQKQAMKTFSSVINGAVQLMQLCEIVKKDIDAKRLELETMIDNHNMGKELNGILDDLNKTDDDLSMYMSTLEDMLKSVKKKKDIVSTGPKIKTHTESFQTFIEGITQRVSNVNKIIDEHEKMHEEPIEIEFKEIEEPETEEV